MYNKTDMHMHSCYSEDGEYSPGELVQMCSDEGISVMAVSDHNTVAGVAEAIEKAGQLRLQCHPAIEVDCIYEGINFHVLGYDIEYTSKDFLDIERNIRKQCARTSRERLVLINKLGFSLEEEDLNRAVSGSYWNEYWTGDIFAEVLLNKSEYMKSELLRPYRAGGARSDNPYVNFYWDYCSQGKQCYAEIIFPDMQEVIKIIHGNGGKAVLAHPGNNLRDRFEMVDSIINLGLDGLEAFSSYHDADTTEWFYKKAQDKGLLVTGGSDFHGKTKPSIKLGQYYRL